MSTKQLSFASLATCEPAHQAKPKGALSLVPVRQTTLSAEPTSTEWLCIYLPQLATEVFTNDSNNPSLLVVTHSERGRPVVHSAATIATKHGIRPGLKLPTAYTLCGDIDVRPREQEKEQQQLKLLAAHLYQFSSQVSLQAPNKLLLEIAASYSLFGGKQELLRQISFQLHQQGHQLKVATAANPQAAEWLAEWGLNESPLHNNPASLQQRIGNLPLQVLQQPKTVQQLQQLGCRALGDVLRLPRAGLARRFGPTLLQQLDRALGHQPDPRESYRPPLVFNQQLDLPSELDALDQFWPGVVQLLERLSQFLQHADRCTRWVQLTLIHADSNDTHVDLKLLRATNQIERLKQLLYGQLDRVSLPAAVREVRIELKQIQASRPMTDDGLNSQTADAENWLETLERLQLRIGAHRVRGIALANSYQPEKASYTVTPTLTNDFPAPSQHRPNWLLNRPEKINRHQLQALHLNKYPERIAGSWWENREAVTRDYFTAQQNNGECLWVYRSPQGWFRHGNFN